MPSCWVKREGDAVRELTRLNDVRYVGDRESMVIHDSWNGESEGCCLDGLSDKGTAVGFEPDTLEQAFQEGFDYCDHCIGSVGADPVSDERHRDTIAQS